MKVVRLRKIWLANTLAYSLAGIASGGIVGAFLGILGDAIVSADLWRSAMILVAAFGFLAALRESNVVRWPLPQIKRQTPERLRFMFPMLITSGVWGFDLGFVFTTWLTYAGPWFVALLAIAQSNIGYGILLFSAHWLGRAAWVWAAPRVFTSPTATLRLTDELRHLQPRFSAIHVFALLLGAITVLVWVA